MNLRLEDKYLQEEGTVFLTGIEALVRLIVEKQRRDREEGGVNQTFISGYEGSPLGGLDLKIVENLELLNRLGRTVHQFGINEKVAASAMLGTQYAPGGDVDAFWYGKAHGTMWIPDELWLANLAGTARRGAMVLFSGEDHRSKSSVSPGASDWVLRSSLVPIFYPASVEEVLRLGMHAIALSRFAGVVTALKMVTPLCDGAGTLRLEGVRESIALPQTEYRKRFNPIVMATRALPMQRELVERKMPLVEEYIRLNRLNEIVDAGAGGEVGFVATGKSYTDVRQALDFLGLRAPVLHLRVSYPLEGEILREFARDLRCVYVVEEPGPFVEDGVKAALWGSGVEQVCGQRDEEGRFFIPSHGEVDPEELALRLWPRLKKWVGSSGKNPLEPLERLLARSHTPVPAVTPHSCGGCPYNSFRALKGEKPGGAIGCSSIRAIESYDHGVLYIPTMGAGGSIYSGTALFNGNQHIFQYLGDGSYFHSGRGAVQSCVQAGTHITFLLLFNGSVALTGGQRPGGQRPVSEVARELLSLGVARVGIVSEEPGRYRGLKKCGVELYALERHEEALARFKGLAGTTALILDKECATERKRRHRRQGIEPHRYILIDEELCEGCGDCYRQSEGCAALYSVGTEFGDKTQVRQAHCTRDELCVDGDCPAFLRVIPAPGVGLRRRRPAALEDLPAPCRRSFEGDYTLFATGRGGTGVVTISHLLAYAAMIEGQYVYLSNNTGLAQKGGPVEAPMVFSRRGQPVFNRLFPGMADLYLGFDLILAAAPQNLRYAAPGRSMALVSTALLPTAGMNRHPGEERVAAPQLKRSIDCCTDKAANVYLDTYWLAEKLFADILFANMLLLGAAYQAGGLPLEAGSIETAIRLNGKAVEENIQAFRWGRLAVADPGRIEQSLGRRESDDAAVIAASRERLKAQPAWLALHDEALETLELDGAGRRQLSVRLAELCAYQGGSYARRYLDCVRRVWRAEQHLEKQGRRLTRAVVFNLYKLMAYKDEYEVARLATRPESGARVRSLFDGKVKVRYALHPPALRWMLKRKLDLGPWFRLPLKLLTRLKGLRGTPFDPFGRSACRRLERELVHWYRGIITEVLERLDEERYELAVRIAGAPDRIRGYEELKKKKAAQVREEVGRLMEEFRAGAR